MISTFLMRGLARERNGGSKIAILSHPAFWVVLGIKVCALVFLTSYVFTAHYIPFITYFLQSHFSNPYEWSVGAGVLFPFPALMLYILAFAKMVFSPFISADSFVLRIPTLLADIAIFLVLIRWVKTRQTHVLWYYWCSPVLFFISYVWGFLDIVPISLLFVFLYFFFKDKYLYAFIFFGLAIAAKTGLVILLPFIFVYLLKESQGTFRALAYASIPCALYILFNLPFLFSAGFQHVIFTGGQTFVSTLNLNFGGAILYIVPLIYLGLLASSFAFQRLHRDIFLMFLAFALGSLTLFVLPEAGWYCWVIPFFVYFYAKEERAEKYPFVLLNVFFFLFFLSVPSAAIPPILRTLPFVAVGGVQANIAFTLLQGALLLNIFSVYVMGIRHGIRHKILYKPYLLGIAGDSASGKSTVTRLLSETFGTHNTLEVAGDDMHKWERGDPRWSTITHLHPAANTLHEDASQALNLKKNRSVMRHYYDHAVGRFTLPERVRPKKIIILQGLHTLYLQSTRGLLDLKIYLAPDEQLRRAWKLERDSRERGADPNHVRKQLDDRAADSEKYIQEQKKYADIVVSFKHREQGIALEVECTNVINIDRFIHILEREAGLTISQEHSNELQKITVTGTVAGETIDDMAYELVPEIWEINRQEKQWEGGLNGVLQIYLAYALLYKAKLDHDLS